MDSSALKEFKEYLAFLRGLWASLGSVSVVFPLSNALLDVIPLGTWPDGGFVYFSRQLVTTIATLVCLFLVLWVFVGRDRYSANVIWKRLARRAGVSLGAAIFVLILYLVSHFAISQGFYFNVLHWESDDMRRIAGDPVLLTFYVGFFALATYAFLLLAMKEFLNRAEDIGA